jgi:hypothetical protein
MCSFEGIIRIGLPMYPNSNFDVIVNNQDLSFKLHTLPFSKFMYLSILKDGMTVISCVKCINGSYINHAPSSINGYFFWITDNLKDPFWKNFHNCLFLYTPTLINQEIIRQIAINKTRQKR